MTNQMLDKLMGLPMTDCGNAERLLLLFGSRWVYLPRFRSWMYLPGSAGGDVPQPMRNGRPPQRLRIWRGPMKIFVRLTTRKNSSAGAK